MMKREEWRERERDEGREVKKNRWRDGVRGRVGKTEGEGGRKEGRRDGEGEGGRERERMECRILRCGCALDYSWTTQSDKAAHKVG